MKRELSCEVREAREDVALHDAEFFLLMYAIHIMRLQYHYIYYLSTLLNLIYLRLDTDFTWPLAHCITPRMLRLR